MTDEELPVGVDFDVAATMRDGVVLRANVYRPSGLGPWPALLVRTPYDKNEPLQDLDPMRAARQGFVVVVQDVRGRFASDGEWIPFRFEPHDGYDSVEWAAGLAGVNGRVGMYSASYCGNVQWLAAFERPPSLGAIAPAMTWSDAREGLLTRGGALELGLAWFWALENGFDVIRRSVADPDEAARRADELRLEFDRALDDAYWELPVDDAAVLHRHGVPAFSGIGPVATPEAVRESAVRDRIGDVEIPSFHLSGWYDIFVQGTLDNFVAMQQRGRDATLVVGPWSHELHRDPIGQLNFGSGAARDAPVHGELDADALGPAWLRSRLDVDAPKPVHAPVRIFVMGRNEWRDEQSWPLAQAQTESWFLAPDGLLSTRMPEAAVVDYRYNPADPVPAMGGHGVPLGTTPAGPVDQVDVEARPDVLVFTSEPLEHDLEVTGRVRATIYADSSAPSTDFVVRLCDVHPDGRSFTICDGITRVEGADVAAREVDLWSTSNVFLAGHRLRVHVTSSSFPRWDRNLNTGDQRSPRFEVADQRIHLGILDGSRVDLPVVREP